MNASAGLEPLAADLILGSRGVGREGENEEQAAIPPAPTATRL